MKNLHLGSILNSDSTQIVSREVKVIAFNDPPPVEKHWVSDLKPKLKEKKWKRELALVNVEDIVSREIFTVAESQLKWVVKGEEKQKNQEAVLFVKRRVVQ